MTRPRPRRSVARPRSTRGGPIPPWLLWAVVTVLVVLGVGTARIFVIDARAVDWAVAAPVWAPYLLGSLALAALLALALHRWVREEFLRVYFFGGYLSLYLAWSLFAVPLTASVGLQLAESVQCHRRDGVVVETHYARTAYSGTRYNLDRTSWVGEYTVDGKTYQLGIREDADVLLRQVSPAVPPDGEVTDPDVVRFYEVAWVGSSHPCARGTTSDFWRGFWVLFVGPWLALGPILAGMALWRRRRETDESAGPRRSQTA